MGCIDARKGIFGNFQHYLDYVLADHTLPCHSDYTISNNPNFEGVSLVEEKSEFGPGFACFRASYAL